MSKTYREKLLDPRWQKKRLTILERDNFCCKMCHNDTDTLNVHHVKYSGNPWESESHQLITLCEKCHDNISNHNLHELFNDSCNAFLSEMLSHEGMVTDYMSFSRSEIIYWSNVFMMKLVQLSKLCEQQGLSPIKELHNMLTVFQSKIRGEE